MIKKFFKKLFKLAFWTGVLAVGGIIALQFAPVRDAAKKAGFDL